jgi:hypothetical protein
MVEVQNDTPKTGSVGGHAYNLVFDGNKLTKKTALDESIHYRAMNGCSIESDPKWSEAEATQLKAMAKFTSKFHGADDKEEAEEIDDHSDFKQMISYITIENLCHERDGAAIMDIKLGTSTNTKRAKSKGAEKLAKGDKKDAISTSKQLGFKVVGSFAEGKKSNFQKDNIAHIKAENVSDYIKPIFVVNGEVQKDAITYVLAQLDEMIDHFTNVNTFEIRGASIFMVLDHTKKDYALKLIDLASLEFTDHIDEGFLLGLTGVRTRI